jgi:hypothetical protein
MVASDQMPNIEVAFVHFEPVWWVWQVGNNEMQMPSSLAVKKRAAFFLGLV